MDNQDRQPQRRRIRLERGLYSLDHVFSVTIGTHGRYTWFSRYPHLAELFCSQLETLCVARGSELFAWCVMPDHVHLLVRDQDVVELVRRLKGPVTPQARRLERGRRLWQRSFYDHGLRADEDLVRATRYILDNPVRAGLVGEASRYPWSGAKVWEDWREYDWCRVSGLTTLPVGE